MPDTSMKILVVDDFATMRRILKNILSQLGYENIAEAEHGAEAYEMIPYVANRKRQPKEPPGPTAVTLLDEKSNVVGDLSKKPTLAKTIIVDRGGFGVRIELNELHHVQRGENSTILILLASELTPAAEVHLEYRLLPFTKN